MPDMTATTMANWRPDIWSQLATVTYRSNIVLAPLMDRSWEKDARANPAKQVLIPAFSQNAIANVTKRTTFGTAAALTFQASTEAQVILALDQMISTQYRQPVELEPQQIKSYLTRLSQGASLALQLQVDSDLAADNTNGIDSFTTVVGTDNVAVSEANLITLETNLANNNAPLEDRSIVVSPATKGAMIKDIEVLRNSLYASSLGNLDGSKGRGFIGQFLTFKFYESNNLEAGAAGKKNGGFQKEAIAYAEQLSITPVTDLNIEDGLLRQYAFYMTYGFKKVKDAFGNELDGK